MPDDTSVVSDAAAQYAKEQSDKIDLETRLKVAFLEGVVWAKEQQLNQLRANVKEVTANA